MSNSGLKLFSPHREEDDKRRRRRRRRRRARTRTRTRTHTRAHAALRGRRCHTRRQVPLLGINRGKIDSRRGVVVPSSDILCDCRHSIKIKPSLDGKSY